MSLEKTFSSLVAHLNQLNDALKSVLVTVSEDKPPRDQVAIVDNFEDRIFDLLSNTHDALNETKRAVKAAGYPLDLNMVRRRLSFTHGRVLSISRCYLDLIAYSRIDELVKLAKRGKEWSAWANTVRSGLDECRRPLEEVSQQIAVCWEELAERNPASAISIQATNIGQKIVRNSDRSKKKLEG